jgi:hypothetical protein
MVQYCNTDETVLGITGGELGEELWVPGKRRVKEGKGLGSKPIRIYCIDIQVYLYTYMFICKYVYVLTIGGKFIAFEAAAVF